MRLFKCHCPRKNYKLLVQKGPSAKNIRRRWKMVLVFCEVICGLWHFGCSVKFSVFCKILVMERAVITITFIFYSVVSGVDICSYSVVLTLEREVKNTFNCLFRFYFCKQHYFEKFIFNSIVKMALAAMQRKANVCSNFLSFYSI